MPPPQKPHKSEQSVQTPPEFMLAVTRRFGPIGWDLAASDSNAQCESYITEGVDSLKVEWRSLLNPQKQWLFLNPPYSRIGPWVEKCVEESKAGAKILCLIPASVGANWFRLFVHRKCGVLFLSPRIKFVGHKQGYPKDLVLCCYNRLSASNYEPWQWGAQSKFFEQDLFGNA